MSNLQVDDVTHLAKHLDTRAPEAPRAYNTIHQYNERTPDGEYIRKLARVRSFGVSCEIADMQRAIDLVASAINHVYKYDENMVKAFLGCTIGKMDMASIGPHQRVAIFSYVALDDEAYLVMEEDFDGIVFVEGSKLPQLEGFNDLY